jgi:hypothetical protein
VGRRSVREEGEGKRVGRSGQEDSLVNIQRARPRLDQDISIVLLAFYRFDHCGIKRGKNKTSKNMIRQIRAVAKNICLLAPRHSSAPFRVSLMALAKRLKIEKTKRTQCSRVGKISLIP